MIKKPLSVVRVAAFCLPLVLVASCGSGSEAIQGTIIDMNPDAMGQGVPSNGTASITNEEIAITVLSPTGYPQIGVSLTIGSPGILSAVSTSGAGTTYTPMGAAGNTYTVTTDSSGRYRVAVSYTSITAATGDVTILNAWSGTAYNRVNITYKCFVPTGGPACPS